MKKATFTIEENLLKAVKQYAANNGLNLTTSINLILKAFFAEKGKKWKS